ncbi:asparaginase [Nocardioides jiangxiensis]|uniref:Asparaginase n=1 Tax=Nocardioides jiangxiensis TaxID=3064524 RepID=A0ABT9B2X8_9ACTN|nr:asparaginase [Nocardioides sp. WY-20]MDO7869048.1 asparaginase [Nocardioides sp. WY-20]
MTSTVDQLRHPAVPAGSPAHVPLVELRRDGMVEGVHHGSAVVLSPTGDVVFAAGDVEAPFYPRSAAKPLQAATLVRLGADLAADQLALAGASHSGEQVHLDTARAVLASVGLAEDDLGNPADLPYDAAERTAWIASGRGPRKLAHNCSGKHAAMLRTCVLNGWAREEYLSPQHPLQLAVAETVTALTGQPPAHVAVDGCGAPLFAVSLRGLARAVGHIASAPPGTPEQAVAAAYRSHPELVAGSRRDTTALMRAVPGLVAKDGFEAVQVAALPDGTAVAVKIADGGDRARLPATLAVLRRAGVDVDALRPHLPTAAWPTNGRDGLALAASLA